MALKPALLFPSLGLAAAFSCFCVFGRGLWGPLYYKWTAPHTIEEAVSFFGAEAERRLVPYFITAGAAYPPRKLALIGLKSEKALELWAGSGEGWTRVRRYEIKKASGKAGPKLREGDRQVPEGFYRVRELNPNSGYHLSLGLDYPNEFDLTHARLEGRTSPGSDIYIHGKAESIGCLAMGDRAIEEIFVAAARVGRENIEVLLVPYDFRLSPPRAEPGSPAWLPGLYARLAAELSKFR